MELEEQFTTCLLMVGPPPEHSTLDIHKEMHCCLQKSRAWRKEVRTWYSRCIKNEVFPIWLDTDADWTRWITQYLAFLRHKRGEANET
jgi:hypothetical protein